MLNITKNADGAALVVGLEGRLDTSTAPELEASLKDALDGLALVFGGRAEGFALLHRELGGEIFDCRSVPGHG